MKDCKFTLEDGLMAKEYPDEIFPKVVAKKAFQAFECTWMSGWMVHMKTKLVN